MSEDLEDLAMRERDLDGIRGGKPRRFHLQVVSENSVHVHFRMWVDGGLAGTQSWCLRVPEFEDMLRRLKPERITYVGDDHIPDLEAMR